MDALSKLYPYQKEAVTETFYNPKGIVCLPTGTGKCLARGTKILMYKGTTKNVEDIVVGDIIMGDDNTPRTILSLANGFETMYQIIPENGEPYTVNESHILSLKVTGNGIIINNIKYLKNDILDIPLLDYLDLSNEKKNRLRGFKVAIDFIQETPLPNSPRTFGLKLISRFPGKSFHFNNEYIDFKSIPLVYKKASKKDRLLVLAGIIEYKGVLQNHRYYTLDISNNTLRDDIIFLTRSLGFNSYSEKSIIYIKGDIESIPIFRKKLIRTNKNLDVLSTKIIVNNIGVGEYFGFTIGDNNRFVLGDFTVTHNTFCQASIIANDITLNADQFRMYVINAPRILLTYQLLKETYSFLAQNNIEARYMFVHSGGQMSETDLEDIRVQANEDGSDIPFSEIESTTSVKSIRKMMLKARRQSLPLIIFSTYNSADKIEIARKGLQPISIILNDEAHYLVQEQFHNILKDLTSSRCYFFTATMINTPSDLGRGMNNYELYGNILYQMIPREAIDIGKMVRPRIHVVKTDGVYDIEDFDKSLNKIIFESFYQHELAIGKHLAPKMLVSVKGTSDIEQFIDSEEYKLLRDENTSIYAVASREEIGNNINGVKMRRQDFLKNLSNESKDPDQKIIILHYDVLSEGIDIPSLTGIMPLRSLNKSKFLQTFGRAARLDIRDRDNFKNKIYFPSDLDKMFKPYAYIIIPNVIHSNEDDRVNLTQIITELRSYGFNPSEDIISSSRVNGIPEIEELSGLNDIKIKIPNIGELIENLEAEIEKELNASMTKTNFLNKNIL